MFDKHNYLFLIASLLTRKLSEACVYMFSLIIPLYFVVFHYICCISSYFVIFPWQSQICKCTKLRRLFLSGEQCMYVHT